VPRNIFPRRSADKTSAEYLASATPEPTHDASTHPSGDSSRADYIEWKQRMAATRRKNLREGLVELGHRKQKTDRAVAARSAYKKAEHERLIHAAERDDERLTNPSITAAMKQFQSGNVPDPDRPTRIAEKAARIQAKQAAKEEERRDALHTLYTRARDFITTESQLNATIDRVFVEHPEEFTNEGGSGDNIWNRGPPETVQQMLNETNKTGNNAIKHYTGFGDVTQKRVRRIAEELTGGKF